MRVFWEDIAASNSFSSRKIGPYVIFPMELPPGTSSSAARILLLSAAAAAAARHGRGLPRRGRRPPSSSSHARGSASSAATAPPISPALVIPDKIGPRLSSRDADFSCLASPVTDRRAASLLPWSAAGVAQISTGSASSSTIRDNGLSDKAAISQWRNVGRLVCGGFCVLLGFDLLLHQLESEPIRTEASDKSEKWLLPTLLASRLAESFLEELRAVCEAERIVSDEDERAAHGKPWNTYHKLETDPDVVVYPKTTEEVVAIVQLCDKYKVPVIAYGGGTSVEGHTVTPYGGVSLDMTLMKGVKALHLEDMDVVVEPGIGWIELNEYLRPHGLFFPLDPGPGATIGGMCATRCSGSLAVRYGTMRENVISLKAVMANGDVVKTAARARKSAAGYDLTRLLIGSEGTLGIITEVTLRLQKIPQASTVAMCNFPSMRNAADVAIAIMHSGIQASRVELLDDVMIKAVNLANGLSYPEEATLMFELVGTEAYALEQTQMVKKIAEEHGGSDFVYALTPEEKVELWKIRKEAFWSASVLKEGTEVMGTDVCVPLSKLAECISKAKSELDASPLVTSILSHAGDGNFHAIILFDPSSKEEVDEAHRLSDSMVQTALALEGTCTGEHGVGIGKIKYLEQELGEEAMRAMGAIKGILDPGNIMNPAKVVPPQFCY